MFSLSRNIVFSPYRCYKHIRVYINLEITLKRLYRFVPFVAYSHFRYVRQTKLTTLVLFGVVSCPGL